jgi:hypothetical protein
MEIYLAPDQVYYYVPQFTLEIARDRVEQKKTSLVAGTVGALLSRPKAEEIHLLSIESRYDPFWQVSATARTRFDRTRTYTVLVSGAEVQSITALEHDLPLDPQSREPAFLLNSIEHCYIEHRASRAFDGLSGNIVDLGKYHPFARTLVEDVEHFKPEGAQIIPPQLKATAVVRQVLAEVVKPAQNAHVIHEERVDVETIALNFLPVYVLEYEWASKGKRSVVEFDALSGEIRTGSKLSNPAKGIVSRDLLFDLTADAAGLLVPGGSIAVKVVKAVVDRNKSTS